MLKYFQVNEGNYINLEQDIPPTARVAELRSCIELVSGEHAASQVLLTSDGRQMDPQDLIGKYSVGTDEKPIFVFYLRYLGTSEPPTVLSRIPKRSRGLQKQLEILKQKPSPSLFHHQVALAQQLCDFSVEVARLSAMLSEEYGLQFSGWQTALSNCSAIIRTFQKHQQLFGKAVERFRADKPHYLELLQQCPIQMNLLQQLQLPSSLQKSNSSSFYDWISTHDEKNSLMDLSNECLKAMDKLDDEMLARTLQTSEDISGICSDNLDTQGKTFQSEMLRLQSLANEAKEIAVMVSGLNKNMQLTSDKALRSGDAKTISVLVESHHKSLHLITNHSSRLETISAGAESSKVDLVYHIHRRLKKVMEMQRNVAESNGQLMLQHENIKLARKRFEILEQVCSTPQVLMEVFGELCRRRSYNVTLEKVMSETSSCLQKSRDEEKQLRKNFQSNYGVHFVTTLFPELQDRVPDVSFHAPKSLSKSYDDCLESLCAQLPQNLRPSIQLDSSIHVFLQALISCSSTVTAQGRSQVCSAGKSSGTGLGSSCSSVGSQKSPISPASLLQSSSETLTASPTGMGEGKKDLDELKEPVGKPELSNTTLTSKLQKQFIALNKKVISTSMTQTESTCISLSRRLEESEILALSLRQKIEELESERHSDAAQEERLEQANKEVEKKLTLATEEVQRLVRSGEKMGEECSQLSAEKGNVLEMVDELQIGMRKLDHQHVQALNKAKQDFTQLEVELSQVENQRMQEAKTLAGLLAEKQMLVKGNDELVAAKGTLNSQLSDLRLEWEVERQKLEDKLAWGMEEGRLLKETLNRSAGCSDEFASVKKELQEREEIYSQCKLEKDKIVEDLKLTQNELENLKAELMKEQQCAWLAQDAMKNSKCQMESMASRNQELSVRLLEEDQQRQRIFVQLELSQHKLTEKDCELCAIKTSLSAELNKIEAMKVSETEKAHAAVAKALKLENTLNQRELMIADLEEKLKLTMGTLNELELQLLMNKEQALGSLGKGGQVEELNHVRSKLQASKEEERKLKDKMEHEAKVLQEKLEKTLREMEERKKEWNLERDQYLRQAMEMEREVKELQRDLGHEFPLSPKNPVMHRGCSSAALSSSMSVASSESLDLASSISLHSLQVGNVALFMCDQYGNYLALSVDHKTYYLNADCAPNLRDMAPKIPQIRLKRKLLIGRVTGRVYMEVRKENNRLKVPVGSRLYKLEAERVSL